MSRALLILAAAGCVQPPSRATLALDPQDPAQEQTPHAVLVLPTTCSIPARSLTGSCNPRDYVEHDERWLDSFAGYIDPPLRLKLELAGFTLAEAGALRLPQGKTVAELEPAAIRGIAIDLGLASMLATTLEISPRLVGETTALLTVSLLDTSTLRPRWTIRCSEALRDPEYAANRLANCAGNGVLAVLAPDNLIGRSL